MTMGALTFFLIVPLTLNIGSSLNDWVPPVTFFVCGSVSVLLGVGIALQSRWLRMISIALAATLAVVTISVVVFSGYSLFGVGNWGGKGASTGVIVCPSALGSQA